MTHEDKKIQIAERTLLLIRPAHFVARVTELAAGEMTYKQAYFIVESEYIAAFSRSKYSSYESFRVIKFRITQPEKRTQLSLF